MESSLEPTNRFRVEPGWPPALLVVVTYLCVLVGARQLVSGGSIETVSGLFRAYAIELAAGGVVLIAMISWLGWDWVASDPRKLEMTGMFWSIPFLMGICTLLRLDGVTWANLDGRAIWWMLATCLLVGFNEELLFRGIWLRSMRVDGRGEGRAALYTAVAFGLFHVVNILLGELDAGATQVIFAGFLGFGLYLCRRGFAWILPAMILHAGWDFSIFAVRDDYARFDPGELGMIGLITLGAAIVVVVAAKRIWTRERALVWQRSGSVIDDDAPLLRIDPQPAIAPATY